MLQTRSKFCHKIVLVFLHVFILCMKYFNPTNASFQSFVAFISSEQKLLKFLSFIYVSLYAGNIYFLNT